MDYTSGGGLLGLAARAGGNFLSNISDFGKDMFDKKGITGAADTDEEEMKDYAAQTFGFDGTTRPFPQQDFPITYPQDKPIGFTFEQEGGNKYFNDLNEEELAFLRGDTDTIADEAMNVPMPFDDSNREAGIMSQYPGTNFIGPRDDPNRRPTMADVAGPMYPGLIPFPEYGPGIVYTEGRGRGDLDVGGYGTSGYDYDAEREGRRQSFIEQQEKKRLDDLLSDILKPQPSRMNLR